MRPILAKFEHRIVLYTVLAGLSAWIIDSAIDAFVFRGGNFSDSLFFNISPHELYFRLFVIASFVLFGLIVSKNLAQRRSAEEELREALARLADEKARSEAVIAAIPDGISIQDRDFRVIYQNDVHRSMVGDQIGKLCYEKYAELDTVCEGCPVARSFADGGRHMLEKTRVSPAGMTHIEISSSPLLNAHGEVIAGIEAVRDVTKRMQTEERLRLFSQALEEAMDGIQIVDLQGNILYSNRAVEEIYGYRVEELAGTPAGNMNVDPGFADAMILPAIRQHGRWSGELLVRHKDGHPFPIWLSTSLIKNGEGRPIAMVGIIRDITNRKQVEEELRRHRERLAGMVDDQTAQLQRSNEQLEIEVAERQRVENELARVQKLESLGLLAGGIAHDFNNLLGSILGNLSLAMLDIPSTDRSYAHLVKADRASLRAQELTKQLLTFSRGGTPVKRPVSLPAVVAEAAGFSLGGSRVLHELDFPKDLWPVEADEGQMMQVFNNLLLNADQAMPDGGIIRISGANAVLKENEVPPLAAGRYVKVSVSDSGAGIPTENHDRIFEPYFTTKQKGVGLGLAATYSIVRRHDGLITVNSTPGAGTTFHLYLPATDGDIAPPARAAKAILGSGRVLLMDDETDMRNTTGAMLERLGYTVAYAGEGAEAVERYREAREAGNPFDAVIMDLMIDGGMGGREAVHKLLEIDPDARVIVSSGYSQDPVMADYRSFGFRDAIVKPYRIRELSEVMARVIGRNKRK